MLENLTKGVEDLGRKITGHDPNTMQKPDDDMQAVLDAQAALGPKPIETLTPVEARRQPTPADGVKAVMTQKGQDPTDPMGVLTEDTHYQGAVGLLKARIYRPENASMDHPLPVVLYFHGGGFVIADIDVYDAPPRGIAKMAKCIVVSAEYRQAPENKFPAAHDDAFAAYQWVLKPAADFGGDPDSIALLGESAGGALALATSIKARDEGLPLPRRQVLVYPVAGVDTDTLSYRLYADAKPLNKAMMQWFLDNYLNSEADKADPRIDAIGLAELGGLEPTTLLMAEIDPLRSDGERLAQKLKDAGVDVNSHVFYGATHEFFGMASVVGEAKLAEGIAVMDLRGSFFN